MLTQQNALDLFDYNPVSGKLFWKQDLPRNLFQTDAGYKKVRTTRAGQEACNVNKTTGYLQVVFNGKLYQVHRVIWLMVNGYWPDQIDHENRNRKDNILSNLSDVSQSKNALNRSDNTSGHPNVFFKQDKPRKPWLVFIKSKGLHIPQKLFATVDEAVAHRDDLRRLHNLPPV